MTAADALPPADAERAQWESAWLALVVHAGHDDATRAGAAGLAGRGGPWTRLLDRFERETLVARAAALLTDLPPGTVPEEVLQDLLRRRHVHHATGLVYLESLGDLLARLAEAGVDALAFKGPALGQIAYGDSAQRGYGDLDVLVRPAQRFRAARVLEASGLEPEQPIAPRGSSPARHHVAVAFTAPHRVDVDLHWGFSTPLVPFGLERAGLWRRAHTVDLGSFTCATLGREDALLHTCFRGAKDDYVYWTALSDLAALLQGELDWDLVQTLATRTGARRMLHLGLLLAADVASASLPAAVERKARADACARELAGAVRERLRCGHATSQGIRPRLTRAWRLRERTSDRVAAVVGAIARVSEPRAGEHWPAWTWPVRRPLRLLRDWRADARPPLGGTSS